MADPKFSHASFSLSQKYIETALGDPLIKGLTEVANSRPANPVKFLADYLHSIADNKKIVISCLPAPFRNDRSSVVQSILIGTCILQKDFPPENKEVQINEQTKQKPKGLLKLQPTLQNEYREQPQTQPIKVRPAPRKMDLSEYDSLSDDAVSSSNAPESAATSDERVNSPIRSILMKLIFVNFFSKKSRMSMAKAFYISRAPDRTVATH